MKPHAAIALSFLSLFQVASTWAYPVASLVKQLPPVPDRGSPTGRARGGAIWYTPPNPPDRGAPTGRARGGAIRGQCPDSTESLAALVPSAAATSRGEPDSVWGLTVSERPTFLFYVPYAMNPDLRIEFALLDEQDNQIYQTWLTASTSAPGITKITPPPSAPALEVGKTYQWYFMVYCNGDDPIYVQGSINRVVPDANLTAQLQHASPRDRAALYAENGIWFDALSTLAALRQASPQDPAIAADWATLLRSADLGAIAQQPFANCCSPKAR